MQEIKQHPDLQSLPVIILTTTNNPEDINYLYKAGAQYYIQKPANYGQLAQVIKRVLGLPEEKKRVQPAKEDFIFFSETKLRHKN